MPEPREAMDYLSPQVMAEARPRWRAAEDQAGLAAGGMLVWPSMGLGAVFDSNPLQRHGAAQPAGGLRLTPRLVAEQASGLHATALYGWADARLYPARPDADQLDGRIGVLHDWAPRRDLVMRLQGELAQARDPIDSRQAVTGLPRGRPFTERDAIVAGSVQKTFGIGFVSVAGDVLRASFNDGKARTADGRRALSDQTGADAAFRLGAKLGPAVVLFAEPSANWRVLDVVDDRSHGTRLVAGLATERLGLVAGELFAGVQRQDYTRFAARTEPVFGGRLTWWPAAAWTVSLVLDRRLTLAAVGTAGEPLGTPVDATSETLTLHVAPSRAWWGEASIQHVAVDYLTTGRRDDLLRGAATFAYLWRHDLTLTADLSVTRVTSDVALASYDRAIATLGARYAY